MVWEYKTFRSQENLNKWVEKNKHKYEIIPIFINNGFGLDVRKLRRVY